jgi:hypothetical protein
MSGVRVAAIAMDNVGVSYEIKNGTKKKGLIMQFWNR